MITNYIYFLYNIKIDSSRKRKDDYIFFYNGFFYIFKNTVFNDDNISFFNSFIDDSSMFHFVIKNRYNRYLSRFDDKFYVLMRVKFKMNRMLLLDDIYSNYNVLYVSNNEFNWVKMWKQKIDQLEGYINNNVVDIYSLSIVNYYLGLSELAIIYFNENVKNKVFPITLCHRRINKDYDLYDYYSITDVVLDHYVRDIAELIKSNIYFDGDIDLDRYQTLKKIPDKDLLVSRLLFPSYFFDIVDKLIIEDYNFSKISEYFVNIDIYEKKLFKIINFIQK